MKISRFLINKIIFCYIIITILQLNYLTGNKLTKYLPQIRKLRKQGVSIASGMTRCLTLYFN